VSLLENIALGELSENIDQKRVEKACKLAQIHEFIISDLPQKYKTVVGERGVRLSGGQRQRIGIARALYRDPDILVFDEATSALDSLTEKSLMDSITLLARKKTLILITHRLSTIKNCDEIFFMEKGRLVASGKFDELINKNKNFRNMAGT